MSCTSNKFFGRAKDDVIVIALSSLEKRLCRVPYEAGPCSEFDFDCEKFLI